MNGIFWDGAPGARKVTRFEAVSVRYVDITSGEFLNLGLLFWVPDLQFADCAFISDFSRIKNAFPDADIEYLESVANAFSLKFIGISPFDFTSVRMMARQKYLLQITDLAKLVMPLDGNIQISHIICGVTNNSVDHYQTFSDLAASYLTKSSK